MPPAPFPVVAALLAALPFVPLPLVPLPAQQAGAVTSTQGYIANRGQWDHPGRFVLLGRHRSLFLEEGGWVMNLIGAEPRQGVGLRFSFESGRVGASPEAAAALPGHHNYFVGADRGRWRSHVPRFGVVRYREVYPGVDLRFRLAAGHPEYDVLLDPKADLRGVVFRVEGAEGLRVAADGSLRIKTAVGELVQPPPRTWQLREDGRRQELACSFRRLDDQRYGFHAADRDPDLALCIDPALIYSSYAGGSGSELLRDGHQRADGVMTLAGIVSYGAYPVSIGAYQANSGGIKTTPFFGVYDPSRAGAAQLLYATHFGGLQNDNVQAVSTAMDGVTTLLATINDSFFPRTAGAYDTLARRGTVILRFDPSQSGPAQLVYSSGMPGLYGADLQVDAAGHIWMTGAASSALPVTANGYDITFNGGGSDACLLQLDPSLVGKAQLRYSTFLGGPGGDAGRCLVAAGASVLGLAGTTDGAGFPTTPACFDASGNGKLDGFVALLDTTRTGAAQLDYCSLYGGSGDDEVHGACAGPNGQLSLCGVTESVDLPTSAGALQRTAPGGGSDGFVASLDPTRGGSAQLRLGTYLGGSAADRGQGIGLDPRGGLVVAGTTWSKDFPVSPAGRDPIFNGISDGFVLRIDPHRTGAAQLAHGTFHGGSDADQVFAVHVDVAGVPTLFGGSNSKDLPLSSSAYQRQNMGGGAVGNPHDAFFSRLAMDVGFYADRYAVPLQAGGTQALTVEMGLAHAGRPYLIVGSASGTTPGLQLGGVGITLNPDAYTDFTLGFPNHSVFNGFRGTLDAQGRARAALQVPNSLGGLLPFSLHHVVLVLDRSRLVHASNAVPVRIE